MTVKQTVINLFDEAPKDLFSIADILEGLNLPFNQDNYKRIDNIIRNLRLKKIIHRHKKRDINNDFQYAMDLAEKDIEVWELNPIISGRNKGVKHGTRKAPAKRKKTLLSKKEIQSMFATQYNTLARLEDEAMKIIEEFEATEKEMIKIRNFIGR